MSIIQEFKEFAVKGNVIDLAVGVVVGSAFTQITQSLVNDIINPVVGMLINRVDLSEFYINLSGGSYASLADAKAAGAATVNYGAFINVSLNFLITAFVIFLVIKYVNRVRRIIPHPHTQAVPPATPTPPKS